MFDYIMICIQFLKKTTKIVTDFIHWAVKIQNINQVYRRNSNFSSISQFAFI
jgi:hypothetical protein